MGGPGALYFWLVEHFIPNAVSEHPLLLLLDGHSSHFEPKSIEYARNHGVIIFCLPPHTTRVPAFGLHFVWTSQAALATGMSCFYQSNPGKVISKLNFNSVFRNAWFAAITPANICRGFKKAGVHPFNPKAVALQNNYSGDRNSNYTYIHPPTKHTHHTHTPTTQKHKHKHTTNFYTCIFTNTIVLHVYICM